jgi:deazaflavin-dependent oxidoreductase (nitroreductase family)
MFYDGAMRLPERLARFNRHVTNPVQRLWAGHLPAFGILEHVGRKSGKAYRTPLSVFRAPGGFAVMLTYGPERDWIRNFTAAGKAQLVHRGKKFTIIEPEVVTAAEALEFLTPGPAALLRRIKVEYVLRAKAG